MKARSATLTIPDGNDRYFSVEAPGVLGVVHFRFPAYTRAARLLKLFAPLGDVEDGAADPGSLARFLEVAGYGIGLCWWHRGFELDAGKPPRLRPGVNDDEAFAYGEEVIDELQEEGLDVKALVALTSGLIAAIGERMGLDEEVAEEAAEVAGN